MPGWCRYGMRHHLHASPRGTGPELLGFRQRTQMTPVYNSISSFLLGFTLRHHNLHPKGMGGTVPMDMASPILLLSSRRGCRMWDWSRALQLVWGMRRAQRKGRDLDSKA